MPLFQLSDRLEFPPAWLARLDGLLCFGGDLRPERIIEAYRNGIFPWFSREEPILWWSPDPRLVLFPEDIHLSGSLRKKIRHGYFEVTMDTAFDQVIQNCADTRTEKGEDTWLVRAMIDAYSQLHTRGYAHSVETWKDGCLVGGLYGLALGRIFFGESMFTRDNDASKTALAGLCTHLHRQGFAAIDCQVTTPHLKSMGAVEIPREAFLFLLKKAISHKDISGPWTFSGFTPQQNRTSVFPPPRSGRWASR
ncbi:MAG: leucyl/phenylalanyl-tRNA--protein transferase [Pseudomonadota bacterium]